MGHACLSWCSVGEILRFGEELPLVTSNSSAWYPYISAVYEDPAFSLPASLGTFGVFMLPATPHPRVPFETACASALAEGSAAAGGADCSAWLNPQPAAPSEAKAATARARKAAKLHNRSLQIAPWPWTPEQAHAANLTPFSPYGHVLANGDVASLLDLPACQHGACGKPPPRRLKLLYRSASAARIAPVANHSWVEVLRFPSSNEGRDGYGCWFWPLLPPYARGSGVFLNTGRTLVFSDFNEARRQLKPPNASSDPRCHGLGDCLEALVANGRGYDTIQMLHGKFHRHPELVVTRSACLTQIAELGACTPASVRLRSGWAANRSCRCTDGLPYLNCGSTSRRLWPTQ